MSWVMYCVLLQQNNFSFLKHFYLVKDSYRMHLSFAHKALVFHKASYSYEKHQLIKLERKIIENQLCYPRMQPFKRGAQQKGRNIIVALRKKLNVLHCITLLKSKSYLHTTLLKRNYFKSDVGFRLAKSYYLNIYFRFALENAFSINISFSHVISKGLFYPQSSQNKILGYLSWNFVTLNSFMTRFTVNFTACISLR